MARVPTVSVMLLSLLAAGCASSEGPAQLTPVVMDIEDTSSGHSREDPTDCATDTVQAGDYLLVRILCEGGSGSVEAKLSGCAAGDSQAWLTVDTKEGRLAQGNATATVESAATELARLQVAAAAEDGKETLVDARTEYVLTLELDAWSGEWVAASVECAAA